RAQDQRGRGGRAHLPARRSLGGRGQGGQALEGAAREAVLSPAQDRQGRPSDGEEDGGRDLGKLSHDGRMATPRAHGRAPRGRSLGGGGGGRGGPRPARRPGGRGG